MAISVSCSCGKKLSVKDELAGKRGKCPACGAMLTIPQPPKPVLKPAEPEVWGLVPLDDDPKPAKPVPASTKPAAAKLETTVAKQQAKGSSKSAPTMPALLADDFGLAPLDDEVSKPAPVTAKPAEKIVVPQANGSPKTPAKNGLGGAAPALLDLPPLDEQGNLTAKSAASAAASSARSRPAAAVQAKKAADGPAPLDLPALDGGEDPNHLKNAAWIDEGAETEYKVAGGTTAATGTVIAPPPSMKPVVREEREGEITCPHCGDPLKRTLTIWNFPFRFFFGRLIIAFSGIPAAFKCKSCGLVHYDELRGASRRAAGTGFAHLFKIMAQFFLLVTTIGYLGYHLLVYISFSPERAQKPAEQNRHEEFTQNWGAQPKGRSLTKEEYEEYVRKNAARRREYEERVKKQSERNKQPTTPPSGTSSLTVPTPSPTHMPPTTPMTTPTPIPTPMQPVSPFEETTLPPSSAPKPMPLNPFQPID